jgi:hypothetical protein
MLLAIGFVGAFVAVTSASAETITNTYDPANVTLSSKGADSITFMQSISNFLNGFVVGVDTLNTATLSFFLKDDATNDNETYKFILGSSSTQTATGNGLNDIPGYIDGWNWTYVPAAPGSLTEMISFNTKALNDLRADGAINITVQALSGDFIFDKAVLSADVTRGSVGGGSGAAVPEPGTVAMFGLGMLSMVASRRKSAKSQKA